jgi:hypothetical protein
MYYAPFGITCQYFNAPQVGEVKNWHKISKGSIHVAMKGTRIY